MQSPNAILDLPALAGAAPDVAAAGAALDAELSLVPDAPADAPSTSPAGAAPGGAELPPKRGPGRPPAEKWSDRKLSKASRAELRARVKDLQERAPAPAPSTSADPAELPPAPVDPGELVAPLALTFATLGTLAAAAYGEHWKLTDDEATTLGTAWAPLAARYADRAGAAMPWGLALLTTAGILAPKWKRHADAGRLAGAESAGAELPPPLRGPDA
jgi:hypothetical protein